MSKELAAKLSYIMLSARAFRFYRFFRHLNWRTLRMTVASAMQRRLMGLSSQMAYNAMLALFPAILVILTVIELFKQYLRLPWTNPASPLEDIAPYQAIELIADFAEKINLADNRGLFSLSFVMAIWVASGALSAAMNALDQIHQIPPKETRPFWKAKLIALGLTIGSILLLFLASFLIFISNLVVDMVGDKTVVWLLLKFLQLLSWPLALAIVTTTIAFIYRFGLSCWPQGKPILPGAVLAAVSWVIVSGLFRHYVAHFSNYNKIYGAVGAVIILQLWLYISSLVFLLGDQLNFTVGEEMQKTQSIDKRQKAKKIHSPP